MPRLEMAVDIAREAGAVLAEAFVTGVRCEAKGRFDLVTDADYLSESVILGWIRSEFPSHSIVAEEAGHHDGSSDSCRWYIDPLDGTKNFARGNPSFSLSIALELAGELVLAVVFDPIRQELFAAERGGGASCNGHPMRVSQVQRLEQCLVTTGFPSATRHSQSNMEQFRRLSMTTQGLRRTGSSALDLSYVASARVDAFWDVGLSAWDVAAGVLLVSEAGGRCSGMRGQPFALTGPDLVAGNAVVHDALVNIFSALPD